MNKKIIGIVVAILLVIGIGVGAGIVVINQNKVNPEDIWQNYISCINEQKYEEMYNMISNDTTQTISKEDFIT